MSADLERKIVAQGMEIFRLMEAETPSLFDRKWWSGQLMELAMADPELKVRLFRFIDVLPTLTDTHQLTGHIREYFGDAGVKLPGLVKTLLAGADSSLAGGIAANLLKKNIVSFARTFIVGETPRQALSTLCKLRDGGRTFTVDILGEAALSEAEALHYGRLYRDLVAELAGAMAGWPPHHQVHEARFPRLNVSVKLSSLYSRIGPVNHDDSVAVLKERLRPLLRQVRAAGGFVNFDMEMYSLREITLDLYMELLSEPEFAGWEGAGLALQAYLKETRHDIAALAAWGRSQGRRVPVRLVKGAYWEYETITAGQKGWPSPVFSTKSHSDWHFERCAELILDNADLFTLAAGTHNVRSLAAVMAMAEARGIPRDRYEFQMLYGMAEPVKHALAGLGFPVREYAPVGELLPGMAYLVRRLLENSSNEGFLRKTFAAGVAPEKLLTAPLPWPGDVAPPPPAGLPPFSNAPLTDLARRDNRVACLAALARVREMLGRSYPLVIGGAEVHGGAELVTGNPADPAEVVGRLAAATRVEMERAVAAALDAQPAWEAAGFEARAELLFRAAAIARDRRLELLAWQVLETGKGWVEADADVAEAIDYLEYYGREALRLAEPQRLGDAPGEENRYLYQPRGVGAVIAPWNFPLAISVGMTAAALAAGNAVLYKPSSLAAVNGWQAFALFREAGVPAGVLNFVPARGEVVGDLLVEHPAVAFIAFTGSREVGLGIVERAGRTHPGQRLVKRVITEMGGKNAIIVDADADLDQAVAGVVQSAFGYQGQKCSACSRVIVMAGCYDRFLARIAEAVRSMSAGAPADPASFLGPLIDARQKEKVLAWQELARREGTIVAECAVPAVGHFVPPLVVAGLPAGSRLLREEVFGPLLAVIRAENLDEALAIANDSDYALTGGLYSRSPDSIRRATAAFRVGNLYVNRPITGAVVGRQPFGGFKLSGVGSKAGGPDYLLQFLEPRVVTENTMRRGFSPEVIA